jgi:uncharacterized protein YjiS (DUF1127 family)
MRVLFPEEQPFRPYRGMCPMQKAIKPSHGRRHMTSQTLHGETTTHLPARAAEAAPPPVSRCLFCAISRWWRARRDARQLDALSNETRKDIGLPPRNSYAQMPDWPR